MLTTHLTPTQHDSIVGLDSDIVVATVNPPAVQLIPWTGKVDVKTWLIRQMNFLLDKSVRIVAMNRFPKSTTQIWCMSDGKAYIVYYTPNASDVGSPGSVCCPLDMLIEWSLSLFVVIF
jgi:hypothetical protein